MKWGDVLIIGLVAGIGIFFFFSHSKLSGHLYLSVRTEDGRTVYPLNQYKKITNSGPLGNSVLVISNFSVYMESSPCPLKICVQEGKINKPHQSIICIPNKIEATILSSNISEVDAVAR